MTRTACSTHILGTSAALASFALVACAVDGLPDPGGGGGDDAAAVADPVPVAGDGRAFVARSGGERIPLLTAAELAALVPPGARPERAAAATGGGAALAPPSYDLSAYQTPVKDQLDRGTCGTFATVAAIEATYRRVYGLTLDLSEQYMFHVAKSTGVNYPRIYQYENQSSYWYGGGWPTDQYMLPLESDAPYAGYRVCPPANPSCVQLDTIPGASSLIWADAPADNHVTQQQVDDFEYSALHIPDAARLNARYGVASYTTWGGAVARDPAQLETLIASNREVVISVDLKWRLLSSGILDYDPAAAGGGHVFLLIGYDRAQGYFLVKNSWGGAAPSAYLKVSYNFLRNAAYDAATVNAVVSPSSAPQAKARWMGKWWQDHEGWPGALVIRRITDPANHAWRLGTYYAGGSYAGGGHSVNGYSIDGNHGLRFLVASETENAPGTLTGQPFEADQYDYEPTHAAGTVWWDPNGEGGVHLGRSVLSVPYSNSFSLSEWLGTWDLDANGSRGTLTITALGIVASGDYPINASLLMGGIWRTVSGTVERARPEILHLLVDGADAYTLHYHFWEDRLASGFITRTGTVRRGAHMVRR